MLTKPLAKTIRYKFISDDRKIMKMILEKEMGRFYSGNVFNITRLIHKNKKSKYIFSTHQSCKKIWSNNIDSK